MTGPVRVVRLSGFDDPRVTPAGWDGLLSRGPTRSVFLTHWWQSAWWEVFGRGELVLLAAEIDGRIEVIAPLFADGRMLYLVGSGGSDALDLIGEVSDPGVIAALLVEAWAAVPDALGVCLYLVPDASPTGSRVQHAARRLGLSCYDEGELVSPVLDLTSAGVAAAVIAKQSLRRHEAWFARNGRLDVEHLQVGTEIVPCLDGFFDQHVQRWAPTPTPSLFLDHQQQGFYRRLAATAPAGGPLRFTRVLWDDRPVAQHFGTCYSGRYLWYKPSFAVDLARRSPGEVLLRALLRAACEEDAALFDLGIGDEAFKARFATARPLVRTWAAYRGGP